MKDGKVFNMKHEEGKEVFREEVVDPELAWYGDGKPREPEETSSDESIPERTDNTSSK